MTKRIKFCKIPELGKASRCTLVENVDPAIGTLGALNDGYLVSNRNARYNADDLYAIADELNNDQSKPTISELFEAHTLLLEKNRRLRTRVSELMSELGRTAEDLG